MPIARTPIEEPLATEPKKSPEELARYQKLVEADRLYLAGDRIAAENLYRQCILRGAK